MEAFNTTPTAKRQKIQVMVRPTIQKRIEALCVREERSMSSMAEALIEEALNARAFPTKTLTQSNI